MDSTVIDYIRSSVELQLMLKGADKNMTATVSNTVPLLVSTSIVRLQRKNVLPPKEYRVTVSEVLDEQRRIDGTLNYNYVRLPDDFRELKSFFVQNNLDVIRYISEAEVLSLQTSTSAKYYSLKTVKHDGNLGEETRLLLNPVPEPSYELIINYYQKADKISFQELDKTYWDSLLFDVLVELGLKSSISADSELSDLLAEIKNKNTSSTSTKGYSTRVPKYFNNNNPRKRRIR